jgi:hypothetical protein
LLQLKQLPQDPLDPQFPSQLETLAITMMSIPQDPAASTILQHLLPLGILPALHERLLSLSTASSTPLLQGSTLPAAALTGASMSDGAQSVMPVGLEEVCDVLRGLSTVMRGVQELHYMQSNLVRPDITTKLLSNTEAMEALVHLGLSVPVKDAARAGSAAAQLAMTEVCHMFRSCAYMLECVESNDGDDRYRHAEEVPGEFLNLEENLPYLQLLCLPLDHGALQYSCCQHPRV